MLVDCLLIVVAAFVSPRALGRAPLARALPGPTPRACVALKGFNSKQQELAQMMELAEKQRRQPEGKEDLPVPAAPKRKGKPPPSRKPPKTREQIFAAMQKLKQSNPDSLKVRVCGCWLN
jgi:hypothetical protein